MPRREKFSIEERLQQAQELSYLKHEASRKKISHLHSTVIYKLAKKSCIVFLWITQFILIDWLLPYKGIPDKITDGYQIIEPSHTIKEAYLHISTQRNKKIKLLLEEGSIKPQINDSIVVLKSLLLHEAKKVKDVNKQITYVVSDSITYMLLPVIIMFSVLSMLFLFVRNIEVKAFFYFMFIANTTAVIFLISYYILKN